MEFSNRDEVSAHSLLRSQSGQAIVEYILILIAVVAVALGSVYQFNDAFKVWANNYFGEYVTCLLETGELPSIDAAPGDSGICDQMFKPFSLADGRPLLSGGGSGTHGTGSGSTSSSNSGKSSHSSSSAGSAESSSRSGGRAFGSGNRSSGFSNRGGIGRGDGKDAAYTGSTAASGYGGGYGATNKKLNTGVRQRVDKKFAFQDEVEEKQKRVPAGSSRAGSEDRTFKSRIRLKAKGIKTDTQVEEPREFTFGNFLRLLIIAAIVIGLVTTLGGQFLQVGEGSE